MDLTIPTGAGVIASIIISTLKKMGFPSKYAPILNLILLFGVSSLAYYADKKTWQAAVVEGIYSVVVSLGTYKAAGKPIRESMGGK